MKLKPRHKLRLIREVYESLEEGVGPAGARSAMARPTGFMDMRYDDLDSEESTIDEADDELDEAYRLVEFDDGGEEEAGDFKKQKRRKHSSIRGQLDNVWVALGKAETKLGSAQFEAEDVNFNKIDGILEQLIDEVRTLMKKVEYARDHVE